MKPNVSNHNGRLLADNFYDPQYIPRVLLIITRFLINFLIFIDHVLTVYYFGSGCLRSYQQANAIDLLAYYTVI